MEYVTQNELSRWLNLDPATLVYYQKMNYIKTGKKIGAARVWSLNDAKKILQWRQQYARKKHNDPSEN